MIELFSANTPNGKKISIMLEEIGYEYKVIKVDIEKGDQFKTEFKKISPLSKIPVIIDHENNKTVFESGAILIYLAESRVEVSEDGLKYQFFPFHIKVYEIRFADIDSFKELIYSPLKDYGGWGMKYSFSGTAYNVSGNKGVKIFLKNGKKVLFGTQKPHKFFEALNKATQQ